MKVEIREKHLLKAMAIYKKINNPKKHKEFQAALEQGQIFKEVALTPFYVHDQVTDTIIVTSKENFDNQGH